MPAILSTVSTDNSIAVTQQLLNALKVPFTFRGVNDSLKQHPDYPSIAALHDVLKEYGVDNMVLQVDKEKLDEIPLPFIAQMRGKTNGFITFTQVTDDRVSYTANNSLSKTKAISRKQFEEDWSGVALLAEKTEQAGEKDFETNLKKEKLLQWRMPLLVSALVFLLILAFSSAGIFSLTYVILTLLKLAGMLVTGMLLWYEIDKNNPFLQKVCSGSKATNCNAILQSKEAKLFGIISWSEIGFFYFAGGLVFVISTQEKSPELLAWLNLAALPYTLFSVYYQWRIAKQWCPLCLAVQALLIAEAILFFSTGGMHTNLPNILLTYNLLTVAFLSPVVVWYFVKPLLLKEKEGTEYKNRFFRMKKDPRIFEALLAKQKRITVSAEGLGITIGNPNATNAIVKVCNPYCGPCAKAHPVIHELLEANENIKVQILFTATTDEKDYRNRPVKHLLAIAEQQDASLTDKALDDWYMADKKDYDVFAAKYPMNGELKQQEKKVKAMKDWCDEIKIEFTPTFFVNGHQLPENYSIDELKYFLSS